MLQKIIKIRTTPAYQSKITQHHHHHQSEEEEEATKEA